MSFSFDATPANTELWTIYISFQLESKHSLSVSESICTSVDAAGHHKKGAFLSKNKATTWRCEDVRWLRSHVLWKVCWRHDTFSLYDTCLLRMDLFPWTIRIFTTAQDQIEDQQTVQTPPLFFCYLLTFGFDLHGSLSGLLCQIL